MVCVGVCVWGVLCVCECVWGGCVCVCGGCVCVCVCVCVVCVCVYVWCVCVCVILNWQRAIRLWGQNCEEFFIVPQVTPERRMW